MADSKSDSSRLNLLRKLRENNEKFIPDSKHAFKQILQKQKKYNSDIFNESSSKINNYSVTQRARQLPNLNLSFFGKSKLITKSKENLKDSRTITNYDYSQLEKKLKANFDETNKLDEKEYELNTSNDEKEVMNLNFWELDHLNDEDSYHSDSNTSNISSISKKSEIDILNFQGQEHSKIKRLNFKGKLQLKSISDQKEEEYGIILLQNINFPKSKFNFDIFRKNSEKFEDNREKQNYEDIIGKKIDSLKQSTQLFGVSDTILKTMNLHLRGNINSLTKPDQYREIIKEKQKKENKFRGELIKIGQTIIEKKNEKTRFIMDISINADKFQNFQALTQITIERLESFNKYLNQLYVNILTNNNIELLHRIQGISSVFYNSVFSSNSSEVRRQIVREKIENVEQEIKSLNLKINSEKNKTNLLILEAKKQIKILNKEKRQYKYRFKTFAKEQRTYYADILKKGIDVRDQGLVWAIKRLIELNSQLDNSSFPAFLENNHINYLLKLAEKQIKCNQKKIMLKTLKEKQKKLREEENNEKYMGISKNSFNFNYTNKSKFYFDSNQTSKSFNKTVFSNKTMIEFDRILQKYEKMIKKTFEKKVEDMKIQGVVDSLKEKLKNSQSEHEYKEPTKVNNIEKFFNENKKQKECFDEILILRKEIETLEKEHIQLREDQLNLFKIKFDNFKAQNSKFNVQYDLIHAALFGNNIYV